MGRNWAERLLALVLMTLSAPLLLVLMAFVAVVDGRPVLYCGARLGRGRRTFQMLKLRTLKRGASQVTGGALLNHTHDLAIFGGKFLRDVRLDELPQLWNIVRGEMSFVGPRPERPEVYAAQCSAIAGYERRFDVRPGLIGISQLFTPHGTAKRYRTLIDNRALRRGGSALFQVRVVALTAWTVLQKSCASLTRVSWSVLLRLCYGQRRELRRLRRALPVGAVAHFTAREALRPTSFRVLDMNEEALLVECEDGAPALLGNELELDIPIDRGGLRPAYRNAHCTVHLTHRRRSSTGARFVVQYRPSTPRSEYMIHQYFLRTSLISSHPIWSTRIPVAVAFEPRPARQTKPIISA